MASPASSTSACSARNPTCNNLAVLDRACFRCEVCQTSLDLNTVAPDREKIYCTQHYRELHVLSNAPLDVIVSKNSGPSMTVNVSNPNW